MYQDFAKYRELIEKTIDLAEVDRHEYLIKPSFNRDLQQVCHGYSKVKGNDLVFVSINKCILNLHLLDFKPSFIQYFGGKISK